MTLVLHRLKISSKEYIIRYRKCSTCAYWEPFSDRKIGTCSHPLAFVHVGGDRGLFVVKPTFYSGEVCSRWGYEKTFMVADPLKCRHGIDTTLRCSQCEEEE